MARNSSAPPPAGPPAPDAPNPGDPAGEPVSSVAPDSETPPRADNRFFAWIRSLDLVRQPGWIGGVCAGIATRLGIDPVIVRAVFVVVAVLGGPAILLYAAAWLLLPDTTGKIHLEQVLRGRFESPVAGIIALIALSMLPVSQGFWFAGSWFWGETSPADSIGRAFWVVVVLGLLTWFIIWIARRAAAAPPVQAPSDSTAPAPTSRPAPMAAGAAGAAGAPAATTPAPVAPQPGAPEEEFTAWREQQQTWKTEYDTFRAQSTEASIRAQEEHRQRRIAAAAASAERTRQWRAANPRLRAAIVAMVLGATVIAGVVAAQFAESDSGITVGFGVATLVVGLAIITAGTFRRRNGFLSLVAGALIVVTVASAFLPNSRQLIFSDSYGLRSDASGSYAQLVGNLSISPFERDDEITSPRTIDIWQGRGNIWISVPEGTTVRVVATIRSGTMYHNTTHNRTLTPAVKNDWNEDGVANLDDDMNGDGIITEQDGFTQEYLTEPVEPIVSRDGGEDSWDTTIGDGATPSITVRIWQGDGNVQIDDGYPEEN